MKTGTNDTIRLALDVSLPKEKTFEAFVEQFSSWWPKAYTLSYQLLVAAAFFNAKTQRRQENVIGNWQLSPIKR